MLSLLSFFTVADVANEMTGLQSRTWWATSESDPIGLAGETVTPKAMREKYSTGTCTEVGVRMNATWPLEREGKRVWREEVREWTWERNSP